MRFREERIRLNAIDSNDHSYRITTETDTVDLVASIKSTGLLRPPILLTKQSSYIIVSGFRRISAITSLGASTLDAWIINNPNEKREIIKIAITENSLQRPLNIVEKARSLRLLSICINDESEIIQMATSVGVPCDKTLLSKLLRICDLPVHVQEGLVNGYISMPVALMLAKFDFPTTNLFMHIFSNLQLSLNRQREIISLVSEIAFRDDIAPAQVINDFLVEVMNDNDLDRNQKTHKLRKRLKQIRFPELTKAEEIFAKNIKNMNLGKGIQIVPPNNFEGTYYIFQLNFKSLKEIQLIQSNLERIIKDPEFEKIFSR